MSDQICIDPLSDVLDLLRAEISERQRQLSADLIQQRTRDANATRLRKSLQPGRDIHGIAEQVIALHHDAADVNANAETHLLTGRSAGILAFERLLNRDGTLHGIY